MKEKIKSFFAAIGCLLLIMAIQVVFGMILGMIIGLVFAAKSASSGGGMDIEGIGNFVNINMNLILILTNIVVVITFAIIYKVRKKNIKEELQFRKTKYINMIIAVALGLSFWIFDSGVLSIIYEAGFLKESFSYMEELLSPITSGNLILTIISVGIIAPFVEEFIFRGVIFKILNKNISALWSIIIQAILFGVFHLNLIQGGYASLMGILFGYVTYKTKSIWPAIVMHISNNVFACIIPLIIPESVLSTGVYIAFTIIGIIGIAVSTYVIRSKNASEEENLEIKI